MAERGRRRAEKEENARALAMLRRFIGRGRRNAHDDYGRVPKTALALRMEAMAEPRADRPPVEYYEQLKVWLRGGLRPGPRHAWLIGESLREIGVPWCSGLWFTWAIGHLDDAVGTLATWFQMRSPRPDAQLIDDVWHILVHGVRLTTHTALDELPAFAKTHICEERLVAATETKLLAWLVDAVQVRREEAVRAYLDFSQRERAKEAWASYEGIRDEVNAAFALWNEREQKFTALRDSESLAAATILVASATKLPYLQREITTLIMFGNWLNATENRSVILPREITRFYERTEPEARAFEPIG